MTGLKAEQAGIILRGEYLEPLGITQTQLARDTSISYLRVNAFDFVFRAPLQ